MYNKCNDFLKIAYTVMLCHNLYQNISFVVRINDNMNSEHVLWFIIFPSFNYYLKQLSLNKINTLHLLELTDVKVFVLFFEKILYLVYEITFNILFTICNQNEYVATVVDKTTISTKKFSVRKFRCTRRFRRSGR